MAENDEIESRRKKKSVENWATKDFVPALPSPGEAMEQKKRKLIKP